MQRRNCEVWWKCIYFVKSVDGKCVYGKLYKVVDSYFLQTGVIFLTCLVFRWVFVTYCVFLPCFDLVTFVVYTDYKFWTNSLTRRNLYTIYHGAATFSYRAPNVHLVQIWMRQIWNNNFVFCSSCRQADRQTEAKTYISCRAVDAINNMMSFTHRVLELQLQMRYKKMYTPQYNN